MTLKVKTGKSGCGRAAGILSVAIVAVVATGALAYAPAPVVFDTPAVDEKGAMILGNGEVGALAWITADGTLHTILQGSDTWDEGGAHLKTGAMDYVTKKPVDTGSFRQELSLERGELEAKWKSGGAAVSMRYRVQHGTDSIVACVVDGAPEVEAKVVNWRLYSGGSKVMDCGENGFYNQFNRVLKDGKPYTFVRAADVLVPGGWCHVNRNETVSEMMRDYDYYQGTGDLGKPDLLSNRVFGAITRKKGGMFLTAVTCLHPCKGADEWLRRTEEMLNRDGWDAAGEAAKRGEHVSWWRAFWNRSHIEVTPSASVRDAPFEFPRNVKLPFGFGIDSKGGNRLSGAFAFAEVTVDGGKPFYSGVPKVGERLPAGRTRELRGDVRFRCRFTPKEVATPQRLFDNVTVGVDDGFLIDVLGGRVRCIFGKAHLHHPAKVAAGRETALEVTVSRSGDVEIVVNGVKMRESLGTSIKRECAAITRRYACQRYTVACAARGRLPLRFNGSLFTLPHEGNPDYRRWGHGYWWQNTRLPYYPMFAAGDVEMTDALFRMYLGLAEFNVRRTKRYFDHGGAHFPECMQPWGDHFMNCWIWGKNAQNVPWRARKDMHQDSGWHKYEWQGQLEISLLAIMRWQHTQDDAWFKANAVPAIREYVRFFDEHYKVGGNGRYVMHPAQATEMWWNCTNPMPEIAGVTRVCDLMLALPDGLISKEDRALYAKIRVRIPELPTRKLKGGKIAFAPADSFAYKSNYETPELYCVFPYRLCSFEKPNAELGRNAYAARWHKLFHGWSQEELDAAYLGMTEEARVHIANRALTHVKPIYRWPAFWGPNFNWCPDEDEGGIYQNVIQSMLMQYEGDRIFLLPAWPKDWNCDFKLHAPRNTTIEGRVENGELKDLVVTPASRRADVVISH